MGVKTMSDAVASINAPRRTAEYNGEFGFAEENATTDPSIF